MTLPLKWEFPGGKLEKDEDEISCIVREIWEELNIQIRVLEKLESNDHDYGNFQLRLIPFLCELTIGTITLREHKSYIWCLPKELELLDWADADIPIVRQVMNKLI